MSDVLVYERTSASFAASLAKRGHHVVYRVNEANHCPACGRSHCTRTSGWPIHPRSRGASAATSPRSSATSSTAPNLGNYEGQCPSILLRGPVAQRLAATDALRPDQAERVAEFVRGQQWPAAAAAE
jgi:hypothetical protein